jgi:hypothetical protein
MNRIDTENGSLTWLILRTDHYFLVPLMSRLEMEKHPFLGGKMAKQHGPQRDCS